MPIPKVGDVIGFVGVPAAWASLQVSPLWVVVSIDRKSSAYIRLRLKHPYAEHYPSFVRGDSEFPVAASEIVIHPFLTSVRNAITEKENQHDEPASK